MLVNFEKIMATGLRAFARDPGLAGFPDHVNVLNASAILLEEKSDALERVEAERDTAQDELGRVILSLPTHEGKRTGRPSAGVAVLRRERDEVRAEVERLRGLLQVADILFACRCTDCTAMGWLEKTREALAGKPPAPQTAVAARGTQAGTEAQS